jgi:hypothetical protein
MKMNPCAIVADGIVLERLRDVRYEYEQKVAYYEGMKIRGELTKDWGECALICARETLLWIVYIERGRKEP